MLFVDRNHGETEYRDALVRLLLVLNRIGHAAAPSFSCGKCSMICLLFRNTFAKLSLSEIRIILNYTEILGDAAIWKP